MEFTARNAYRAPSENYTVRRQMNSGCDTYLFTHSSMNMHGRVNALWLVRRAQGIEEQGRRTILDLLHSASECTCRQIPAINLSADVGVINGTDGSFRTFRRGKRLSLCTWRIDLVVFCGCSLGGTSLDPFRSSAAPRADVHSRSPPTTFRLLGDRWVS